MNKEFKLLCTPAKIYFFISILSIIFFIYHQFNLINLIINIIFVFIWTLVLSCLCDKGFTILSWALVLLPYFFLLLAFFQIETFTMKNEMFTNSTKQKSGFHVRELFTPTKSGNNPDEKKPKQKA